MNKAQKIKELNLMMDRALTGVNSGLGALEILIHEKLSKPVSNLDALEAVLHQRRLLLNSQATLSRPLEQRADGLYYTGRDR